VRLFRGKTKLQRIAEAQVKGLLAGGARPFNPVNALLGVSTGGKAVMKTPKGRVVVHKVVKLPGISTRVIASAHFGKGAPFVQKTATLDTNLRGWENSLRMEVENRMQEMARAGAPVVVPESIKVRGNHVSLREKFIGPTVGELLKLESLTKGQKRALVRKTVRAMKKVSRVAARKNYVVMPGELHEENALYDYENDRVVFTDLPLIRLGKADRELLKLIERKN